MPVLGASGKALRIAIERSGHRETASSLGIVVSTMTTPTIVHGAKGCSSVDVTAEFNAGGTISNLAPVVTGASLMSSTVTGHIHIA